MIRHDKFLKKASVLIGFVASVCVVSYAVKSSSPAVVVLGVLLAVMSAVQWGCLTSNNQSPVCKMWSSLTMQVEGCLLLIAAFVGVLPVINAVAIGLLGAVYLFAGKVITRTHREVVCGASGNMD